MHTYHMHMHMRTHTNRHIHRKMHATCTCVYKRTCLYIYAGSHACIHARHVCLHASTSMHMHMQQCMCLSMYSYAVLSTYAYMRTWLSRHVFVHIAIEFMPFPRLSHAVPRHEYTRPEAPRPEDSRPEGSNISEGEELFCGAFMRATHRPMNRRNRGAIHLRRPATRTRQKFERREAERRGTLRRVCGARGCEA